MSSGSPRTTKLFSVEQANAVLPLVRAIVTDLTDLGRELLDRRERLDLLKAGRPAHQRDLYSEEVAQIEEELEKDSLRLNDFVGELRELGVEPKSATVGLVDFPAVMDGRPVCLCWRLGETEVLFWHECDAGFAGRQPLTAGSVAPAEASAADGSSTAADGL